MNDETDIDYTADIDATALGHQSISPRRTAEGHQAPYLQRAAAQLLAGRLDRQLTAGVAPTAGSLLAVHAARLASADEREALARTLRTAVVDAASPSRLSWRVPVHRESVLAAGQLIDDITLRLHSPRPVRYQAIARLRVLLADGRGPLYRRDRGSLNAELKAVLARM